MWKKTLLLLTLFTFALSFATPLPEEVDAKPRFSSGKRSFTTTPKKADDTVIRGERARQPDRLDNRRRGRAHRHGLGQRRRLFQRRLPQRADGGRYRRPVVGSLLGTGFFGQMFGLFINVLAILALFMLAQGRVRPDPEP